MFTETIGRIKITSGKRGKSKTTYPTCRVCSVKIKEGNLTVTIHKVGEYPSEIHLDCANKLVETLEGAILEATLVNKPAKKKDNMVIKASGNRFHLIKGKHLIVSSRGYLRHSGALRGAWAFQKMFRKHPPIVVEKQGKGETE